MYLVCNCLTAIFCFDHRRAQGTLVFANGDTYRGQWSEGQRCGHGEMLWATQGERYVGTWKVCAPLSTEACCDTKCVPSCGKCKRNDAEITSFGLLQCYSLALPSLPPSPTPLAWPGDNSRCPLKFALDPEPGSCLTPASWFSLAMLRVCCLRVTLFLVLFCFLFCFLFFPLLPFRSSRFPPSQDGLPHGRGEHVWAGSCAVGDGGPYFSSNKYIGVLPASITCLLPGALACPSSSLLSFWIQSPWLRIPSSPSPSPLPHLPTQHQKCAFTCTVFLLVILRARCRPRDVLPLLLWLALPHPFALPFSQSSVVLPHPVASCRRRGRGLRVRPARGRGHVLLRGRLVLPRPLEG